MLHNYDKALVVSALALAALASPVSADPGDPVAVSACQLEDGYGAGVHAFALEATACLTAPVNGDLEETAETVLTLTDRQREKAGAAPLVRRESLEAAARAHAMDMAARNYAAHRDETGRSHLDRIRVLDRTGIYGPTGANITVVDANTDAIDLFNTLISDTVNADNVNRHAFTHQGIGVAEANGSIYLVQLFAQIDGELSEPLAVSMPQTADLTVQFADPAFSAIAWRLEDGAGQRVRQGSGNDLTRTGNETGDLHLVVEADRDGVIYALKGPAMTTTSNGAAF